MMMRLSTPRAENAGTTHHVLARGRRSGEPLLGGVGGDSLRGDCRGAECCGAGESTHDAGGSGETLGRHCDGDDDRIESCCGVR